MPKSTLYWRGVVPGGSGYVRVAVSVHRTLVDYAVLSNAVKHSYRIAPVVRRELHQILTY